MKFSVILPFHNSENTIARALISVMNQTYRDFEVVLVNDGSTDGSLEKIRPIMEANPDVIKYTSFDTQQQRAIAYNQGMRIARGEWVCWLDADDEYLNYYLEVMSQAIKKYPESFVFNFGGVVIWNDWKSTIRSGKVHFMREVFKSGDVMSGGFVFHRGCLRDTPLLPEYKDPYSCGIEFKNRHPEIVPLYTLPDGRVHDDLGNPWGQDYMHFYELTRRYEPKFLNIAPFIVYIRGDRQIT